MKLSTKTATPPADSANNAMDRRALLLGGSLAAAGLIGYPIVRDALRGRASVFVARHQAYDGPIRRTIEDGLIACGLEPQGCAANVCC